MEQLMETFTELMTLLDLPDTILLFVISILNVVLTFLKTSKKRIKNIIKPDAINTADYVAVVDGKEINVDDLHIKKLHK